MKGLTSYSLKIGLIRNFAYYLFNINEMDRLCSISQTVHLWLRLQAYMTFQLRLRNLIKAVRLERKPQIRP